MKWEVLSKNINSVASITGIINVLLKNRGIKNKKEFFEPKSPYSIKLKALGIKDSDVKKVIKRISLAKKRKQEVIVYGDYDADGVTATAILWEALHAYGLNVLPHIPDRFEEGYGINPTSVENLKLKNENLKLIITVDNGIVAYDGIKKANELGIDVIVIDHHTKGSIDPKAYSIIHTPIVCGSALAWFFAKELMENGKSKIENPNSLELAAIGTIADQMPLLEINRSIVKYGLIELNKTKRVGLKALFLDSKIEKVGTYEVNYIIVPRINAMGRLASGLDSLRLLCTTKKEKAEDLAKLLSKTNLDRQKIVTDVVLHTKGNVTNEKVIVIAHESYHEGVIGLAAGKLVEEFYRPSIVISKGKETSKASARSISGFNIIEAIKATGLILEGGGHPMAAGFSIETAKIGAFTTEMNKLADKLLTNELLEKKIKIDCEIDFIQLDFKLLAELTKFEPFGLGNPNATFISKGVEVLGVKTVGKESRHLKLKLKQNEQVFDSIYFGGGEIYSKIPIEAKIDIVYSLEENIWNGRSSLQLKIKDVRI